MLHYWCRYAAPLVQLCCTFGARLLNFSGTIRNLFEKAASPFEKAASPCQSQHYKRNEDTRVLDVQASRFAGFGIKEL